MVADTLKREISPREREKFSAHFDEEQVSVIRREFVALTGDPFSAVILNQLLYWTQRVRDFDLLLQEERTFRPDCNVPPRHGWIYKTAQDLIEETMLGISPPTMRKYLKLLIDQGWIDERAHPIDKWNKTTQYRVNLRKLQEDLMAIGYKLPSVYLKVFSSSLQEAIDPQSTEISHLHSTVRNFHSNENLKESLLTSPLESEEIPNVKILHSNAENFHSDVKNLHSDVRNLHSYTYTETTSKNTNREHTARAQEIKNVWEEEKIEEAESASPPRAEAHHVETCRVETHCTKSRAETMVEIWEKHVASSPHLTQKRKEKLLCVLNTHFQNDVRKWDLFCQRIKDSPFLRGEGPRGWRVTLDWILEECNLLKVLEGNFDDPSAQESALAIEAQQNQAEKTKEILASIEDPVWREWCVQFSEGIRLNETLYKVAPLNPLDLEKIVHARFLELEGEKLLWVGSSDASVLNKIEDLRLTLSSYFTRTYPKFRTIRTRLIESSSTSQNLNRKD